MSQGTLENPNMPVNCGLELSRGETFKAKVFLKNDFLYYRAIVAPDHHYQSAMNLGDIVSEN
jgi:hypothetical protein